MTDQLPQLRASTRTLPRGVPEPVEPGLSDYQADQVRRTRRALRVRGAQDSAMDRPFTEMAKARFRAFEGRSDGADASEASGRAGASALGLVSNETSGTRVSGNIRESIRLNMEATRLKRMRTSVGHAARLLHFDAHCERHVQRWNKLFVTLTYADVDGWEPGHFSRFRDAFRQWCRRRGVRARYVWVAELQQRGALHYHIVVWMPKGVFVPKADRQGWWPHGATNIKTAQSPIGYITKYASKTTPEGLIGYPKGARMCGHGGLTPEGRRHIRYWQAPIWVRDALGGAADIRKVTGGYCNRRTGEFLASPWRVVVRPDGSVWAFRVDPPTETIH